MSKFDKLQDLIVDRLKEEAYEQMSYPGPEGLQYHVNSRLQEIADMLVNPKSTTEG